MPEIAERLRRARQIRGLSRRGLSLQASLAQAVVGRIERGDVAEPSVTTLAKLSAALDVSLDWLVRGEGEGPVREAS